MSAATKIPESPARTARHSLRAAAGSDDWVLAICPHCGSPLMPPRRMLGDTIICKDTGKEFTIQEHDPNDRGEP